MPSFLALLIHAGPDGKRSMTGFMCYPAHKAAYGDGYTPDLALDGGDTTRFTEPPVDLGSFLNNNRIVN